MRCIMAGVNQRELEIIKDRLLEEEVLIKKYTSYASMCSDPQIKTKCEQMAAKHKNHFNSLMQILNKQ